MNIHLSKIRTPAPCQELVPQVLDLTLAARHPVDAHFSQPTRLDFIGTMDYDGGHHGVGGRRVVSMGKSSGVALACLGRSLGARSTRNTGKWRLVSALRVRRHSALVALVARLPKLDPLLAGSTTLSVEIVLGRKLMWPGQTSVVAVSRRTGLAGVAGASDCTKVNVLATEGVRVTALACCAMLRPCPCCQSMTVSSNIMGGAEGRCASMFLSLNLSPPDLRLWARASKDFLGP